MALNNFIPTLWSARLLANLDKSLIYGRLVNHDYEGEIKGPGATVTINQIGDITVSDFDKAKGLADPEQVSTIDLQLTVDQAKSFNFGVNDIDKVQSVVGLMDAAMQRAAYKLADVQDSFIAGLYTGVDAANTIGSDTSPIVPTKDNAYDNLVDLGTKLDEANVPSAGRWCVVPAWYYGLLLKDARFTRNMATMATGDAGTVDSFTIYKSNNVPNTEGAKYKIIAGTNAAISFAQQITEMEAYRPEKNFSDAVKGLSVYGAKLLQPKGIAVLTANKS